MYSHIRTDLHLHNYICIYTPITNSQQLPLFGRKEIKVLGSFLTSNPKFLFHDCHAGRRSAFALGGV
jgi:hypothetical protein